MNVQDLSNEFSDESDIEEMPVIETEDDSDIEVVFEIPPPKSNDKQQKSKKRKLILKLDRLTKCKRCSVISLNSRQSREHQQVHNETSGENKISDSKDEHKFRCDFCKIGFQNASLLREHIKSSHMKAFYEDHEKSVAQKTIISTLDYHCGYCNEAFNQKDALKGHLSKCDSKNTSERSVENTEIEKSKKLSSPRENKCNKCDKAFHYKSNLKRHLKIAHKGFRYKCKECPKEFISSGSFSRHKKSGHSFHKNLKNRSETYENEKKCAKCNKEFSSKFNLITHNLNIHEGLKHKCEKCDQEYAQRSCSVNLKSIKSSV